MGWRRTLRRGRPSFFGVACPAFDLAQNVRPPCKPPTRTRPLPSWLGLGRIAPFLSSPPGLFRFFLFFFVFDRDVTWFYCFTVLDSDGLRFAGLPSSSGGDFAGFYWVDPSIFADGSNYIAPSRPRSVSFMPASSLFFYLFHCWLVFLLPSAIHKEQSRSMMLPYSLSRHECAPATNYSDTFCGFYLFCAVIPSPTTCISLLSPFTWIFRFDPVGALYLHNVAVFLQYTMSNWAWEVINSTMLRFLEFVFHSLGRTKPPSVLFLLL